MQLIMPKKTRKARHNIKGFQDVTINDFANSPVPKNIPKKPLNNVNVILRNEVEKSWDEKNEEELEALFELGECDEAMILSEIQKSNQITRTKSLSNGKRDGGRSYPIDVWYLISDYMRPEDVGKFAAICKTSLEVVRTASFWFGLYRRYYRKVPNMPEALRPESLIRKYGLRKNVIRALYLMYPPFINRRVTTFKEHPESLKSYECHLIWYIKNKAHYMYFFKMKRKVWPSSVGRPQVTNLLERLDDISANTDEHCRILEVLCLHFNPVPPVLGQTLKAAILTLSSGCNFAYHRLQLTFGSAINSPSTLRGGSDSTTVILDPVISIKVLDWWHPQYPLGQFDMGELVRGED